MGPVSYPCLRWAHHYGWSDAVWLLKPGYKADTTFAFSSGNAYFWVPVCLRKPKQVMWKDIDTKHQPQGTWVKRLRMIPGLSPWAAASDTPWNEDAHSNCIFMKKINCCCAKPLKSWHYLLHSIREMSLSSLKAQYPSNQSSHPMNVSMTDYNWFFVLQLELLFDSFGDRHSQLLGITLKSFFRRPCPIFGAAPFALRLPWNPQLNLLSNEDLLPGLCLISLHSPGMSIMATCTHPFSD